MKKKQIDEIIDTNNNIIGVNAVPDTGNNKETEASGTTDDNMAKHGQSFKSDFLGRFGFYFYESDDSLANKNKLDEDLVNKKIKNGLVDKTNNDVLKKEKLNNIADLLNNLSDDNVMMLVSILKEKRENE